MEWLAGGGPIMIPIFICSIVAAAVVMERAVSLRRNRILQPELIEVIEAIRGPEDLPVIHNRCNVIKGPFSNIIKRAISNTQFVKGRKGIRYPGFRKAGSQSPGENVSRIGNYYGNYTASRITWNCAWYEPGI